MVTYGPTPNRSLASPPEPSSLRSHCHVFRDLRHRATTFTQPFSHQPVTTRTTRSTALKHTHDALTHPSHDAVAHQGHDESLNTYHFVSAMPTQSVQRSQIEEFFQHPSHWDTELLKSARDAGPSGLHQHLGVEERKVRPRQWDTETPLGSRDADPPGLRRPRIDDSHAPAYHRDTVALQGPRDADPLGSRRPGIDDSIQTRPRCSVKLINQGRHYTTETPECHETLETLVRRVHHAHRLMTRYKETSKNSSYTDATLQSPVHPEPIPQQMDTESYYRLRRNELPYHLVQPGTSAGSIVSLAPADAPSNPLEVEGLRFPKPRPLAQPDRADSFKAHLPQLSVLGSYAFTCTPHDNKGNLSSTSDPTFQENQILTESTKAPRDQDQVLADTLRVLFKASENEQALLMSITEVKDDTGVKKYEFAPEYAELLASAMHLITSTLNDYWENAGTTKTFSFGWSSNYDMAFSKLIYRRWATRLVLNSIKDRLLTRIRLAMEAIEECSFGTGYVSNTPRPIGTDQARVQDSSPRAEDLLWELRLKRDRSAILRSLAAATVRTPSSERSRRQKEWDSTRHLNVEKKERTFKIPQLMQDMLSQDCSSSEDTDCRSRHLEAMSNLETPTTAPVLLDYSTISRHPSRTSETTTTWKLDSHDYRDNSYAQTTECFTQQSATEAVDTSTTRLTTRYEQSSTPQRSQDPPPPSTYLSRLTATGTTRHQPPDQATPYALCVDLRMPSKCDDQGINFTTRPNDSGNSISHPDQDCVDIMKLCPNVKCDCGTKQKISPCGSSRCGTPFLDPYSNDRVRSPLDDSRDCHTKQKMLPPGLTSNLRRGLPPSSSPQGSPYQDDQGLMESQRIAIVSNLHQRSDSTHRNTSHAPSLKIDATTLVHRNEQPTRARQPIQPHDEPPRTETKASRSPAPANSRATLDVAAPSGYLVASNYSDGRVPDATADAPSGWPFISPYQVTMALCSDRSYDSVLRNLECLQSSRTTTLAHQDRKSRSASNRISRRRPSSPEHSSRGTEFRLKMNLTIPAAIAPRTSPDVESRDISGQPAKFLVEQPPLEKKPTREIAVTITEPELKSLGFTKAATMPKVCLKGHHTNELSTSPTRVQLTNCLTTPSYIPDPLACPDQADSESQPTLAILASNVPQESATNRKAEPIQLPLVDDQHGTLRSPRDKDKTSSGDSATDTRIRSQGGEPIGFTNPSLISAATSPPSTQMQCYYPGEPHYYIAQPPSILSTAIPSPFVGSINLFIRPQPHLQADHEISAISALTKPRLAKITRITQDSRNKINASRQRDAESDPLGGWKGTVFVRSVDDLLKEKSQQQRSRFTLVLNSRTGRTALSPSRTLSLSMDCYYVDYSLLPFGHRTKGPREQLGSAKELGLEGVRILLGSQSLHDQKGPSESSEACKGRAKYILEGEYRYHYSSNWPGTKPAKGTFIYELESSVTTGLTDLLDELRMKGARGSPITHKFTHGKYMLTRRNKEKTDFLVMLSSYKHKSQAPLALERWSYNRRRFTITKNPNSCINDYIDQNRGLESATNQKCETQSERHKAYSEYPVIMNYVGKASSQWLGHYHNCLGNEPRNDYRYKRNKTVSYNRPANAVNINREELRIAMPRGEDEGSGAHGDSYTLLSTLTTNAEKDRAPRLNTGLSEKSSTKLLENYLLSIPDTQTPANQAIRGVDPYKTLRDANGFKKVIEFTISALGTTHTWNRTTNHELCCCSLLRSDNSFPVEHSKESPCKTYARRRNAFEVEKKQRRENLEFRAELDESALVTKDPTPLTTPSSVITPATEELPLLRSDEATRKPETFNFEADLINSPQGTLERITVKSRLMPQPQEVLYKRLEIIQIAICTSIQGTDSIPFAPYNGRKTAGRTSEEPSELSALDSSKETVLSRTFERTTKRIKFTSKNSAKPRNTRLMHCPSPFRVNKLRNEISECGLPNHQRNSETTRKLELSRDRKKPNFTSGLAACHATLTPYSARKMELFVYGLQINTHSRTESNKLQIECALAWNLSVLAPPKGCREHERKYRHHLNTLNHGATRASLLLRYRTTQDPRIARVPEKLRDLLEKRRTRRETPSRRAKEFRIRALSAVKTQYPAVPCRATAEPETLSRVVIALPVSAVKHKTDLEPTHHHRCRRHNNWPPVTTSTPHLTPRLIRTSRMMMPCPYHHLGQLTNEEFPSQKHSIEKEVLLSSLPSLKFCKKLKNHEKQAERCRMDQFWDNALHQPTSAGETTAHSTAKGYRPGKELAPPTPHIWARSLNLLVAHKTQRVADYRHTHDQCPKTKPYLGASPARHPSQSRDVTLMTKAVLTFRWAKLVENPLNSPSRRMKHYEPPRSYIWNRTLLALLMPNHTRSDKPTKDQLLASPWSEHQEDPKQPKDQSTVYKLAHEDEVQALQRATFESAGLLHFLTTLLSSLEFASKMFGQDCRTEWVAKLGGSQFPSHNSNHSMDQTVFLSRIEIMINTFRRFIHMRLKYTIPELMKLVLSIFLIARLELSLSLNLARITELNTKDPIISCTSRSTCLGSANGRAFLKGEIKQRLQTHSPNLHDLAKAKITTWKGGSSGYQTRWKSLNSKDNIRILAHYLKIMPDLESRRKSLSRATLTCDHRLIGTHFSKNFSTMSQYPHEHYHAIVTINPTALSPVPIDQGPQKGYFNDKATRSLLSLDPSDCILHSGTYGEKELSTHPIAFSTLQAPRFDQRFLPFTPRNHAFTSSAIDKHEQNGQFPTLVQTYKNLEEHLNRALLDAQLAGNQASISLPNYALILVLRLKYSENGDGRLFPYQFLVFFSPSATWMCGVCIGRVMAILDTMTNCAHAMVNGPGNWPKGEPLLATFRSFGIPITRTTTPNTNIPSSSADLDLLSGTDNDALYYAAIDPNHDVNGLEADGLPKHITCARDDAENASIEGLQDGHEDNGDEPAPPYVSAEVEVGPTGQSPLLPAFSEEPVGNSNVSTLHPRKSTVLTQRLRNYMGPYTQPALAAITAPLQSSHRPLSWPCPCLA